MFIGDFMVGLLLGLVSFPFCRMCSTSFLRDEINLGIQLVMFDNCSAQGNPKAHFVPVPAASSGYLN